MNLDMGQENLPSGQFVYLVQQTLGQLPKFGEILCFPQEMENSLYPSALVSYYSAQALIPQPPTQEVCGELVGVEEQGGASPTAQPKPPPSYFLITICLWWADRDAYQHPMSLPSLVLAVAAQSPFMPVCGIAHEPSS